jgi:rRNA maturation endonuclease Nob1
MLIYRVENIVLLMVKLDPLNPWHYFFFRRRIKAIAKCPCCKHELREADIEEGKCPSCGKPLKKMKL